MALSSVLAACSGSDEKPAASPSKTSSSPSATTSPAAPEPAVTAQPAGANGVTWKIADWETYGQDPAVVEWTHIHEDLAASVNQGSLIPTLAQRTSKSVLRKFVDAINVSKQNDYRVATEGDVKVLSAKTDGTRARLTMCMWSPTTGILDKNGTSVGEDEDVWFKQEAELDSSTGQWILESFDDTVGTCSGGPPA